MSESPVTIDPRLLDAVIVQVPQSDSMASLERRLQDAGVEAVNVEAAADAARLRQVAASIGTRAERCAVITKDPDAVTTARSGGFSLVIALASDGVDLLEQGADVVIDDVSEIAVRTGDRRMSEIPNALDHYTEMADALGGRLPAVCLDYDGTLSEIVPDADAARLVDGAAEALARLAQRCPVAILSGRDLANVRDRVAVPGLWYAGSHGFESIAPDGSYRQNEDAAAAVPVLERAAGELREILADVGGSRVEHKRFAVAVHYRDVAADDVGEVVAGTHRVGRRHHLRVTNGRKVVELRPDVDWNKGTTLAWIREQIEQSRSVTPVYIGDDLTDEDAFDAVAPPAGIGILVRHTEDGDRRSAARYTLDDPEQVRELLDRLADGLPTT
ncbi:MAG: trehalose 6-phosphate phosphatase [Mycobacterium sp.]|jgi:trehalose-phosphatase|nr:trehalose 6-phosphate phosphatase [Mycobacterium sp.]